MDTAYLVLESGEVFPGSWRGGEERAGEVVFNTSHSGYEEMATDPSYYSQILVLSAPMQGNYGADLSIWESRSLWIEGFISLEIQDSPRDRSWLNRLNEFKIPVLTDIDTRKLVLHLRNKGTPWGAMVKAANPKAAAERAQGLIQKKKSGDLDWAWTVSRKSPELRKGQKASGPRVAVLDFGCKENTLRELEKRCSEIQIFPSRTESQKIRDWKPDGILLSNGPGNPEDVQVAAETVKDLLGWRFIFGICMGHQILGRALGGTTHRLKFGHRASNHPIKDELLKKIYVTSQNHGYVVDSKTLPSKVAVSHVNLNDGSVSGIFCEESKCLGVQFHPESHPGPNDSVELFDFFIRQIQ